MAQRNMKLEEIRTEPKSAELTEEQRKETMRRFWEAVERIGGATQIGIPTRSIVK
jgi:hypothetical protein